MLQIRAYLTKGDIKETVFLFATIGVIIYFYHAWFQPGILLAGDFQVRPPEHFDFYLSPKSWMPSLYGGYHFLGINSISYPIYFVAGILSTYFGYDVLQRLVWLYPFLAISYLSFYFFIRKFTNNRYVIYLAALFYVVNPAILERLAAGHVWFAMAYAFFPLITGLFIDILHSNKPLKRIILMSLAFSVAMWFEVRVAFLSLVPIAIYLLYYLFSHKDLFSIIKIAKVLSISSAIIIVLNIYWIVPMILYPPQLYQPSDIEASSLRGTGTYGGTLVQAFQIFPGNWGSFYTPVAALIPILSFSVLLTKYRKNLLVLISSCAALLFVFLGKGSYEPFGEFYVWLMQNVPFAIAYRNPSKWWFVTAFLYSFLMAFTFEAILNYAKEMKKSLRRIVATSSVLASVLLIIILSNVFLINGFIQDFGINDGQQGWDRFSAEQNMFNVVPYDDLKELYYSWDYIKANSTQFSRTLWLPTLHNYRFASEDHPLLYPTLFSSNEKLPYNNFFLIGANGNVYSENIDYDLGIMLGLAGVEHIVLPPPELNNWYISRTPYSTFRDILDNQPSLTNVNKDNTTSQQLEQMNWNTSTPAGVIDIVNDNQITFKSNDGITSLLYEFPSNADAISKPYFTFTIKESVSETIGLIIKDKNDNVLHTVIPTSDTWTIHTMDLSQHPTIDWQNLQTIEFDGVYGGYTLFLKDVAFKDYRENKAIIYENKEFVPPIYLPKQVVLSDNEIVDALEMVKKEPENVLHTAFVYQTPISQHILDSFSKIQSIDLSNSGSIEWKRQDSTKYEVNLKINSPQIIVFAEAYDSYWKLYIDGNKQSDDFHFRVNGYANGFFIDKPGSYALTIVHEPQELNSYWFTISIAAFVLLVGFVIRIPLTRIIQKNRYYFTDGQND